HIGEQLLARHLAGLGRLARLHNNHDFHGLISCRIALVESGSEPLSIGTTIKAVGYRQATKNFSALREGGCGVSDGPYPSWPAHNAGRPPRLGMRIIRQGLGCLGGGNELAKSL